MVASMPAAEVEFATDASCCCTRVASGLTPVAERRPGLLWSYDDRRRGNDSIYTSSLNRLTSRTECAIDSVTLD